MDSSNERTNKLSALTGNSSIVGQLRSNILGAKLAAIAITLASFFSIAAFVSTYLSFDRLASDPSALLARTAMINALSAALLTFVTVCIVGLVFTRRIKTSLDRFSAVTQEAAAGNLSVRVGTATGAVEHGLASSFNAMMDRMEKTAQSELAQKQSLLAIIKAVESSGDAISVTDATRAGTYYNKRYRELFACTPEGQGNDAEDSSLYEDSSVPQSVLEAVARGES